VQLEGFSPRAYLRPLLTNSHSRIPTCLFHLGNMHLHCSTIHRLLHFPFRVSTTGQIRNSQSSVAGAGLSLGENHFPTNSLTWRELLTGLTTCLFNHGSENPLFQPASTKFQQVRTIARLNIAQGMATTTIR
jgi:hypothetical protein